MGEVIELVIPKAEKGWVCGCGCHTWVLLESGEVICAGCDCIASGLKVVTC